MWEAQSIKDLIRDPVTRVISAADHRSLFLAFTKTPASQKESTHSTEITFLVQIVLGEWATLISVLEMMRNLQIAAQG